MANKELLQLLEGLPDSAGLKGFEIAVQECTTDPEYVAVCINLKPLKVKTKAEPNSVTPYQLVALHILDTIAGTEYAQDRKKKHERHIMEYESKIRKLKEQLKEAEVYKNHYDLEMKLRHGEG